ncbi:MAG: polyamine aminopropyltransferase [Rectinema sp.]
MRTIIEHNNPHYGFFYEIGSVIVHRKSKWQDIELAESPEFGKVLLLDGITQVGLKDEERYHETLVIPAMIAHPRAREILIIGGGDGCVLREVLACKGVRQVIMADIDAEVISVCREYLPELNKGAFDDPRLRLEIGDGRTFVEHCPDDSFDVVIMDMTDPFGPSERLYTKEFFMQVQRILKGPEGIFAMHGESSIARPIAWACIYKTLNTVFPIVQTAFSFVPMYGTLWSFQFSSCTTDLLTFSNPTMKPTDELKACIAEKRSDEPRFAKAAMWPALFAEDPSTKAALGLAQSRVITDIHPHFPDVFEP